MPRQVVVIGGGQGGLTAAIYARLRGWDALLLEQLEEVGGKARQVDLSGYRLDPGPSIIILPRIYEAVFKDAGRSITDYLRLHRLDPISRIYFEGSDPVDIPAGRAEAERLIGDIAPGDRQSFVRLMAAMDRVSPLIDKSVFAHPYERSWQVLDPHLISVARHTDVRHAYKEVVDRCFHSPLLRAFFYGFPSYGGQSYDSRAPGALMIPYLMLQEGVFYPEGGVSAIPRAFERLALELGVEIRTGARVKSLRHHDRRICGAMLQTGEEILADAFISNVDRSTTRSWSGREEKCPPSFSYFTLHFGVRRKLEGLAHHTLLIPGEFERGFEELYQRRRFPEPPIVYLNETSQTDASTAPRGCSNLFAVVTSPAHEVGVDWERAKRATIKTMERFGFLPDPSECEFERVQTPAYFASTHGNYLGSLYGVDQSCRPFGGMFPHHNRDEQFKNLFYCGGSVQPGAGLPMVTLSGRFAANCLDALSG